MDKDAEAFRTISEVGEDLDLPQHVLRFWETRFPQIRPIKRGGGRRYYRPEDCDLLRGIKHLLYGEGYTIKGVQRILKEEGPRTVQAVGRAGTSPAARKQKDPVFTAPLHDEDADDDAGVMISPLQRRDPVMSSLPPAPPERQFQPQRPVSLEPQGDRQLSAPWSSSSVEKPDIESVKAPTAVELRAVRVDPAAPALPGFEPVANAGAPARKAKPKQLALFDGMEEEGLSSKDREVLRQVLDKIAECRKLIASADLMDAAIPTFADL